MILVTGATGLVGGNLMWHLLQENERVQAIRRTSSNLESLHTIFSFYSAKPDEYLARIDWKIADVLDIESIRNALCEATIIYHCAAIVSLGDNADKILDTNVIGTRNIVQVALEANIQKFCFVSSIAACGKEKENNNINESSNWNGDLNRSSYSLSKYYSEQEVWKGIQQGLNAVIVNPGVVLGISGSNTGSSKLFSTVRKGLLFYTYGGTGYVNVQDVTNAMIQLTKSKITGERFVLVGENCSNKNILRLMANGYGKQPPFIPIGKRMLWLVGIISEIFGKTFHFQPLIDRGIARSATQREYYSSQKIVHALNFKFTSIEISINDICKFQVKKNN